LLPFQQYGKTVTAIDMKLSGKIGNAIAIMLLSLLGGSAMLWGTGRGLLCLESFALCVHRDGVTSGLVTCTNKEEVM